MYSPIFSFNSLYKGFVDYPAHKNTSQEHQFTGQRAKKRMSPECHPKLLKLYRFIAIKFLKSAIETSAKSPWLPKLQRSQLKCKN